MKHFFLTLILLFAFPLIRFSALAKSITWHNTVFSQGGYAIGQVTPGSQVTFLGHELDITSDGHFIIGFGRDMPSSANLRVVSQGKTVTYPITIQARQYKIERIDGLPNNKVNPRSQEDLARIRRDTRQVVAARAKRFKRNDFLKPFTWPANGRISGVYGSQRVLNGDPKRPHYGIDIAAITGTKVVSPNDGIVSLVHEDMFFSGGTLIIDHGYGLSSTFLHLNAIHVEPGQVVKKGELIADIGATGRATGPHLDWRMNWMNQRLDPQLFVGEMKNITASKESTER